MTTEGSSFFKTRSCKSVLSTSKLQKNNHRANANLNGGVLPVVPLAKNFIQLVLIKRGKYFSCSECAFKTINYKSFYAHCMKQHYVKSGNDGIMSKVNFGKFVYHCTVCQFATFSVTGFKSHCRRKHRKLNHEGLINCVPLSNPKAEVHFKSFIGGLKDGKQKRQALQQLNYYFERKNKLALNIFSKNKGRKKRVLRKRDNTRHGEPIMCMMCDYKNIFPNSMEEHYQNSHNTVGPLRNEKDEKFYCDKCSFSNISYKALHKHFQVQHQPLDMFSHTTGIHLSNQSLNHNSDLSETSLEKSNEPNDIRNNKDLENDEEKFSSADGLRLMKCDQCGFTTKDICMILNHWRTMHNRVYPLFVKQHIEKDFHDNMIIINLPVKMVPFKWINGWINSECTGLIQSPTYNCHLCNYSNTILTTMSNHYATSHPDSSWSMSKVNVVESGKNVILSSRLLCQQNTLYQCKICNDFTSCFYKNMLTHYKSKHRSFVDKTNGNELSRQIRSCVVMRCVKCNLSFSDVTDLLNHYNSNHSNLLPTFTCVDKSDEFACNFCQKSFGCLQDLSEHLENHQESYFEEFKKQHITGYCCSKCRRIFRAEKLIRHHHSRIHVEWSETSFNYNDFPQKYFCTGKSISVYKPNRVKKNLYKLKTTSASDMTVRVNNSSPGSFSVSCLNSSERFSNYDAPRSPDDIFKIGNDQMPATTSKQNRYECYLCPFKSQSPMTMRFHIKQSHGQYLSFKKLEDFKIVDSTINEVNNTVRKVHSTCSHHTYIDKNPIVYQKHVYHHHNAKHPHDCPHCSCSYVCEVVLRMHIRKKHKFATVTVNKRSYAKRKIFFSCIRKNILTRNPRLYDLHIKEKHSDDKPYHCPKCPRIYICVSMFSLHIQRHHKITPTNEFLISCKDYYDADENETTQTKQIFSKVVSPIKENCKDYQHPKSVYIEEGKWKCLYCKQFHNSYSVLRKHIIKSHPNCQIIRCRWCDFTCKTNVQLANHSKIHNVFIANRMKVLRQIWKTKRLKGLFRSSTEALAFPEEPPPVVNAPEHAMDVEERTDDTSELQTAPSAPEEPIFPIKPIQTARKSIKPCSSTSPQLTRRKSFTEDEAASNIEGSYKVTHYGTIKCNLCEFVTTDRDRIMMHLKSSHAQSRIFRCMLCFFEKNSIDEITNHLTDYHKMERNQHMAMEVMVVVGPNKRENGVAGRSGRLRRRIFEPEPSLPIIKPSDLKDIFDPSKKVCNVAPPPGETKQKCPQPLSSKVRVTRSRSTEAFGCKYCDIEIASTYEMERHMMRHESSMLDGSKVDEVAFIFSPFIDTQV